jgi:hypothetical protein
MGEKCNPHLLGELSPTQPPPVGPEMFTDSQPFRRLQSKLIKLFPNYILVSIS